MPDSTRSEVHRFLTEERGITDETLERAGVTFEGELARFPHGKSRRHDADGTRHFISDRGASVTPFVVRADGNGVAFVVEGESDTLRLYQELEYKVTVVGIPGVNAWKPEWRNLLDGFETVFVILDNDEDYKVRSQVDKCWLGIRKELGARATRVELPGGVNDICEFFDRYSLDALRELTSRAVSTPMWHYDALDLLAVPSSVDWLVDGLIAKGDLCMLIGEPGVGKSWLSMALAVAIAEGRPSYLGRGLTPVGSRVLYVDEENPAALVPYRLGRLGLSSEGTKNIRFLHQQGVRLDRHPDKLLDEALDWNPDLIVLDSLTRIHTKDENNAGEISGLFNDGILPLVRTTGATCLVLHHVNKTDSNNSFTRARGSSDLSGVIDTGLDVSKSGEYLAVKHYKSRWTESGRVIQVAIEDVADSVILTTREVAAKF